MYLYVKPDMNTKTNSDMKKLTTVERAYKECHAEIYAQALQAVKNPENAEDIRANVYLKIQRLDCAEYNDDKGAEFESWIYTITNTVILDFFRTEAKKQNRLQCVSDFADQNDESKSYFFFDAHRSQDADQMVMNTELQKTIAKAFRTLKPHYRKIAILFFLREKSYQEISEILDIPMGSVKGMLSRAKARLQDTLEGVYGYSSVNVQNA